MWSAVAHLALRPWCPHGDLVEALCQFVVDVLHPWDLLIGTLDVTSGLSIKRRRAVNMGSSKAELGQGPVIVGLKFNFGC